MAKLVRDDVDKFEKQLSALEQQKQCFHYTNLQPLWAIDNLSKGKKICQNHQEQMSN